MTVVDAPLAGTALIDLESVVSDYIASDDVFQVGFLKGT